jgi:hypothetical protein
MEVVGADQRLNRKQPLTSSFVSHIETKDEVS